MAPHFFFAYARKDSDFVLGLATELRAAGVKVWLDQLDVVAGQRWDHAVEEALRTSQGLIAVLSPESLASQNVMDEISYALEEAKLVVPVLFKPAEMPFRLRRVQHVDFTKGYEIGFAQLLRAVGAPASVPPPDAKTPTTVVVERPPTQPDDVEFQQPRVSPREKPRQRSVRTVVERVAIAVVAFFSVGSLSEMAIRSGWRDAFLDITYISASAAAITGAVTWRNRRRLRSAAVGAAIGAVIGLFLLEPFGVVWQHLSLTLASLGAVVGAIGAGRRWALVAAAATFVVGLAATYDVDAFADSVYAISDMLLVTWLAPVAAILVVAVDEWQKGRFRKR